MAAVLEGDEIIVDILVACVSDHYMRILIHVYLYCVGAGGGAFSPCEVPYPLENSKPKPHDD